MFSTKFANTLPPLHLTASTDRCTWQVEIQFLAHKTLKKLEKIRSCNEKIISNSINRAAFRNQSNIYNGAFFSKIVNVVLAIKCASNEEHVKPVRK